MVLKIRNIAVALLTLASVSLSAQTWKFTSTSDSDQSLIAADIAAGGNWAQDASQSFTRYYYNAVLTDEELIANGETLAETAGLKFTTSKADNIRIDVSKRLQMNGTDLVLTIPDLKAGYTVEISFASSSSSVSRTLTTTNLSDLSGFTSSTSSTTQTGKGTVTADGDVTFTTADGGVNLFYITLTTETGGSVTSSGGSVSSAGAGNLDVTQNQAFVTVDGGETMCYNTADLTSITLDKTTETVTVAGAEINDVYTSTATSINFALAQEQGESGTIANKSVTITEAKAWNEMVYAKWSLLEGADSYNVYVKGGQYSDYTQVNSYLVRNYGTYGRVDVPGLMSGASYSLKVVPVTSETEGDASEATDLIPSAYDRSGFAFMGTTNPGAYNSDGTLKDDAIVLYVTNSNFTTVSLTVNKNAKGETTTFTGIHEILDNSGYNKYASYNDNKPLCVRIIGTINTTGFPSSAWTSSSEGLQVKFSSNSANFGLTIEGIGDDATIHGFGILCRNTGYVELRNFAVMCAADDCISLDTDNLYSWVHHLDLFYGSTGSDSDQAKGDGTIDVKGDSKYQTYAYNHFWDSGKSSLCGMKSESGPNYIDYNHNWFDHSDSRHPRVRTMTVHVWNNYYDGVAKYGVGATSGASVFVEKNFFRHSTKPMLSSLQGTDATGDGTFSGEDGGMIKSYANVYAEKGTSSSYTPITHTTSSTSFDCYEATTRDEQVPSTYVTVSGATTYNNFDTDESLMFAYEPDLAVQVPSIVTGYYGAGRLNHGDFQWSFDNSTEDTNYSVITELKSAINSYSSSLVSIFGSDEAVSTESTGSSSSDTTGDTSDDTSGDTSSDTSGSSSSSTSSTIDGSAVCYFTGSAPSLSAITVSGNYSTSKGSVTVNGTEYTTCVKMESSTSISFTTTVALTMTVYFSDSGSYNLKVDGTKYASDTNTVTVTLEAGTHTITKADSAYVFYIDFAE